MKTTEVKHNHPLDTDPGRSWESGEGRVREKGTVGYYKQKCWESLQRLH